MDLETRKAIIDRKFTLEEAKQVYASLLYLDQHGEWPPEGAPAIASDIGRAMGTFAASTPTSRVLFEKVAEAFAAELGIAGTVQPPSPRVLTPETKQQIRQAFRVWEGPLREGMDPYAAMDQVAHHVCGMLELPEGTARGWYRS